MNLKNALNLAREAHAEQEDKGGNDYIFHPIYIALQMNTEEEKIVALLHDVLEDSDISVMRLYKLGFSERVINAVRCLTHVKGEPYFKYINKIKENTIAVKVKLADLQHNADITRIPIPTQDDYERVDKYKAAIHILSCDCGVK